MFNVRLVNALSQYDYGTIILSFIVAHNLLRLLCVCVCRSYPEVVTGVFFILMTLLWFTREPGFVPGWTSLFEK